jgi:hypothetical protein
MKGIVSTTIDWLSHPLYSEGTLGTWVAGLTLILLVSFLWATVVRQIE